MGSKKLLITGGVIAAVAATAILVPSLAAGVTLAPLVPTSVVTTDDGPGDNGRGNAFGYDKDSPGFPGNNRNGGDDDKQKKDRDDDARGPGAQKHEDGPGNNGRGHAFGHDKDSPDFPGNNGNRGGDGEDDDADD